MRRLLFLLFLLLSLASCRRRQTPAADPTIGAAQSEDARQKHNAAVRAYQERNYDQALVLYEEAYKLGRRHTSLLGAADCLKVLRRNQAAHDAYQHVLVVHGTQLSKDEKKKANLAARDLNVPAGTVTIEVLEPDAEIEVDGRPAGRSPMYGPRELSAGPQHTLRVTKAGFSPFETTFQLGAQEQKKIEAKLGAGGGIPIGAGTATGTAATPPPIDMSDSERRAAARAAFIEGVELQDKGDCNGAMQRFETAQRLFDAPTHLLHLAECQAAIGKLVEARETYNTLDRLKLAADAPDAFKKAQLNARAELTKLKPRIPSLKIETVPAASTLKNLTIQSNGARYPNELIGIARPVNPGPYRIVATTATGLGASSDVDLKEGEQKTVELRFVK
jgi:tetratricopeptide (TPR) repeat protein